tara:strand:+ start:154 stop:405 length:252 start_codon:yes stop_codon:yes gene_type:complete
MPLIRLFGHESNPIDDIINDVEMDYAPMPGDILEFESRDGENIRYQVVSRVHKFGPQETPGSGMLAVAVKEITKTNLSYSGIF